MQIHIVKLINMDRKSKSNEKIINSVSVQVQLELAINDSRNVKMAKVCRHRVYNLG